MVAKQRLWNIDGWNSTKQIFHASFPLGQMSERGVERLLQVLVAKHALTEQEIVDAHCVHRARRYAPHLEVQRSSRLSFSLMCGSNPYFVATVCEKAQHGRLVGGATRWPLGAG
jgi:hypothetical protein